MTLSLSRVTYRTITGFGEATNEAYLASLGGFDRFCGSRSNPPNMSAIPTPSKFLQLPDELLLDIALSFEDLDANQHLCQLALTCRRLRGIAREALIRVAVVTPRAVRGYVQLLFQYPEHIPKVRKLYLYATQAHAWPDFRQLPLAFDAGLSSLDQPQLDIIKRVQAEQPQIARVQAFLSRSPQTLPLVLLALVSLLSNLEDLSLSGSFVRKCSAFNCLIRHHLRQQNDKPCRQSCIIKTLALKITTLELIDIPHDLRCLYYRFQDLSSLKELSVSAEYIIYDASRLQPRGISVWRLSEPSAVLPSSLEVLKMYIERKDCQSTMILGWIEKILDSPQAFPLLRHFQLFVKMTFQEYSVFMSHSAARALPLSTLAQSPYGNPSPQLKRLARLEEAGISLKTFFWETKHERGSGQTAADDKKRVQDQDPSLFLELPHDEVLKLGSLPGK